jgi:hypothetical protein
MYALNRIVHAVGCSRIANESGAVAFNPHIVVAPCISTMSETHPVTLVGPEISAPIGDLVAMFIAEIVDEHFLNPRGKGIDTNLADVDSNYEQYRNSHRMRNCSEST